ncbi:MAG: hypothetical protein ACRDUS_07255 [Mycobacterium sp.]
MTHGAAVAFVVLALAGCAPATGDPGNPSTERSTAATTTTTVPPTESTTPMPAPSCPAPTSAPGGPQRPLPPPCGFPNPDQYVKEDRSLGYGMAQGRAEMWTFRTPDDLLCEMYHWMYSRPADNGWSMSCEGAVPGLPDGATRVSASNHEAGHFQRGARFLKDSPGAPTLQFGHMIGYWDSAKNTGWGCLVGAAGMTACITENHGWYRDRMDDKPTEDPAKPLVPHGFVLSPTGSWGF